MNKKISYSPNILNFTLSHDAKDVTSYKPSRFEQVSFYVIVVLIYNRETTMMKRNESIKARYIEKWDNDAMQQSHTYARAMLIAVSCVNRRRPLA